MGRSAQVACPTEEVDRLCGVANASAVATWARRGPRPGSGWLPEGDGGEDCFDGGRIVNGRHETTAAAAVALQNVEEEHTLQQLRPTHGGGPFGGIMRRPLDHRQRRHDRRGRLRRNRPTRRPRRVTVRRFRRGVPLRFSSPVSFAHQLPNHTRQRRPTIRIRVPPGVRKNLRHAASDHPIRGKREGERSSRASWQHRRPQLVWSVYTARSLREGGRDWPGRKSLPRKELRSCRSGPCGREALYIYSASPCPGLQKKRSGRHLVARSTATPYPIHPRSISSSVFPLVSGTQPAVKTKATRHIAA